MPDVGRLQRRHWLLVAVAAAVAWVIGRPGVWGVVVGGMAIGVSTFLYAATFRAVLRRGSARLALSILFVKLLAFLGLGWLAFSAGRYRPDPMGFTIGVSCLPIAALWEAIRARNG